MISLRKLREYWQSLPARVNGLKSAEPLSVESNMADKVGKVSEEATPVLFHLAPSIEITDHCDARTEQQAVVLFVMQKYNPRTTTSEDVLAEVQPVAAAIVDTILDDARQPCFPLRFDRKISIMPETEFFGNWAGWSIALTIDN